MKNIFDKCHDRTNFIQLEIDVGEKSRKGIDSSRESRLETPFRAVQILNGQEELANITNDA